MARLLDLGEEDEEVEPGAEPGGEAAADDDGDGRTNPNMGRFSAALTCYPIVSQLASYLDLNSLHDLSRTCRQFRAHLLQYRAQLIEQSLTCANENSRPAARLGHALHASHQIWRAYGTNGVKVGRITSGKLGACARDLVGPCRRCSKIICRNCTIKAPPSATLKGRHRRLCRADMKAPLDTLTVVSSHAHGDPTEAAQLARSPCTCTSGVWICQPCGNSLRPNDTTYMRGWAWRTRYSACGGLGAGLGEGNEGVECGRGANCQAFHEVYQEIECDAEDLAAIEQHLAKADLEGHQWAGSSYLTQEIVGIGGAVKKKIKKRVPVGAAVKEYEDEREGKAQFLSREQAGDNRSWCSWCERVVPGKKDVGSPGRSSESVISSSSSGSA
ncbi:hypothetical protein B0A55_08024 [Friedmanniomyces simplex]|uniref:F-box domain-containing protein n=1 Tax=Friedmanniomyces simplex TaxID=329884 RepID=A0A4U0X1I3_9PEZI|nr:hypothetical protein B0A55_08024 [Friedmanniomyces simplex]